MAPTGDTRKTDPADKGLEDRFAPPKGARGPGEPHAPAGQISERRDDATTGLAAAYRKGEPYMAASSTLVASVAVFTAVGYWLDRRMGHSVQWLLLVGAVVGMVVGFVSFFTKVLRRPASKR